jgi:putative DNA primase/helicase
LIQLNDVYKNGKYKDDQRIVTKPITSVKAEKGEFLMLGYIARNSVSIFAGEGGIGKSFLSLNLAQKLALGVGKLPNGEPITRKHNIVVFATEDGENVMAWRMKKMGALADNIHVTDQYFDFYREDGAEKLKEYLMNPPEEVTDTFVGNKKIDLIILDPITAYSGDVEINSASKVGRFLSIFQDMAKKENCDTSFLGITHTNKNSETNASNRIMGSTAWRNKPRNVVLFGEKDGDVYTQVNKANWIDAKSVAKLKFRINKDLSLTFFDDIPEDFDIDELLHKNPSSQTEKAKAEKAIVELLDEGKKTADELRTALKPDGFSDFTIRDARESLKEKNEIEAESVGKTDGSRGRGTTYWVLKKDLYEVVTTVSKDPHLNNLNREEKLL